MVPAGTGKPPADWSHAMAVIQSARARAAFRRHSIRLLRCRHHCRRDSWRAAEWRAAPRQPSPPGLPLVRQPVSVSGHSAQLQAARCARQLVPRHWQRNRVPDEGLVRRARRTTGARCGCQLWVPRLRRRRCRRPVAAAPRPAARGDCGRRHVGRRRRVLCAALCAFGANRGVRSVAHGAPRRRVPIRPPRLPPRPRTGSNTSPHRENSATATGVRPRLLQVGGRVAAHRFAPGPMRDGDDGGGGGLTVELGASVYHRRN